MFLTVHRSALYLSVTYTAISHMFPIISLIYGLRPLPHPPEWQAYNIYSMFSSFSKFSSLLPLHPFKDPRSAPGWQNVIAVLSTEHANSKAIIFFPLVRKRYGYRRFVHDAQLKESEREAHVITHAV